MNAIETMWPVGRTGLPGCLLLPKLYSLIPLSQDQHGILPTSQHSCVDKRDNVNVLRMVIR